MISQDQIWMGFYIKKKNPSILILFLKQRVIFSEGMELLTFESNIQLKACLNSNSLWPNILAIRGIQ